MRGMEEKTEASSLVSCVCQLLLNASEKLCFQLKGPTCPRNFSTWHSPCLEERTGEMNWTSHRLLDFRSSNASLGSPTQWLCSENITTLSSETKYKELSSLGTAAIAISGSLGVVALILLIVGLLSMSLKKWKHERLFKRQLRHHQSNFLQRSSEISSHADAIYSNVIYLGPWKEEDFAIYANVPRFDRTRRTSPDQVEYASIVFH